MNIDRLRDLPVAKLVGFLEMALRNSRTIDGLWFLAVEERFGTDAAVALDELVWERMAPFEARRLKELLDLPQSGIPAIVEALRYSTTWMSFAGEHQVEQISENRAVLRISLCHPQRARVEKQMGIFPCKSMEQACLSSFARAVDPTIKVRSEFTPEDRPPESLWCEWFFEN